MANVQHSSSSSTAMIGSTTTFYEDSLHAAQPEPEGEYPGFLEQFPQQPQYHDFNNNTVFPTYSSQAFAQPRYLPTPSVSPTSTSGRQIVPVPRHSPSQYYAINGAIEQHQQIPSLEPPNPVPDRTKVVGKRERTGPPQRRKAQAKVSPKTTAPRKRPRKSADESGRASPAGEESGGEELGEEKTGEEIKPFQRLPGACRYCKKLKMRCEFPDDSNTCRRCKSGGHQCIVEGRKPRSGPNKREFLLNQLRQKDAIIDSLLKQVNNPVHRTPLNLALPSHPTHSTSPEPAANKDVLAWIEKIQGESVRTAGGGGGAGAFNLDGRAETEDPFEDGDDDDEAGAGDNEGDQDADADLDQSEKEKKGKLHSLPEEAAPLGLIANLSLRNTTPRKPSMGPTSDAASPATADATSPDQSGENDNDVGVANATYFLPGPATNLALRRVIVERTMTPDILVHGLVTPSDVEKLFEIFYERMNPFVSILDPVLHTPAGTLRRCPFLFTVVCAVASRYYTPNPDVYKYAMHFAKSAAAASLINGWKSVELCQAYLLMSIYPVPARRWEEDRSWLYLGLAIRIATDLNLHQPSSTKITSEKHEREILNRTRTWMICFNLDRSTSTQLGKPSTIKEDFIIRNSTDWYKRSAYNLPYDVHLCAYTELLRLVTRFHEEVYSDQSVSNGLNKQVDFHTITMRYDDQLRMFQEQAAARFNQDSRKDDPGCVFRTKLLPFIVNYSRLVMFSFGFQDAVQRGLRREDVYFQRCFDSACAVINTVIDLSPTGYMRFAPDGHFIFASFASAFLLKLLRPDFAEIVGPSHKEHILSLVRRLIKVFASNDIAMDDRHTPKLYSRFLGSLVARYAVTQEESRTRTIPKLESSPGDAPMSSLPELTIPLSRHSGHMTQPSQMTHLSDSQYGQQTLTLSPTRYDGMYPMSSASGNTVTPYNMDGNIPEVANEDLLASMQAINNPVWWDHVMMPGFSWPESVANSSGALNMGSGDSRQQHHSVDSYAFVPHGPFMPQEHPMS